MYILQLCKSSEYSLVLGFRKESCLPLLIVWKNFAFFLRLFVASPVVFELHGTSKADLKKKPKQTNKKVKSVKGPEKESFSSF